MSDDMYDWEVQPEKFAIQVALGIYVHGVNEDRQPQITCGFLETQSGELHLPYHNLTHQLFVAYEALNLAKKYIGVDPRTLDIVPCSFFDPITTNIIKANRTIVLYYQTWILPGTPINPDLRMLTDEEIRLARQRTLRGHYEAYRAGASG